MSKFLQSIIIESDQGLSWENLLSFLQEEKVLSEDDIVDRILSKEIILEDGKNSIGIKEVQELSEWNSKKSQKIKLALIRNAEKLTSQAQNSLLKIIEEPNINNLIVLETNNLKSLLETIRSRCKKYRYGSNLNTKFNDINFELEVYLKSDYNSRKLILSEIVKTQNKNNFLEYVLEVLMNYFVEQREMFTKDIFNNMIELLEYIYLANKRSVNFKLLLDYLNFNLIKIK